MKSLFTISLIGLTNLILAQDLNEVTKETEDQLTNGNKKSWVFYKTVETMGSREIMSQECVNDTLTFYHESKTYVGKICKTENQNEKTWSLEGNDPYEIYIVMGKRYMIDIYYQTIDGEKIEILRLKQISNSKSIPSIAYVYKVIE